MKRTLVVALALGAAVIIGAVASCSPASAEPFDFFPRGCRDRSCIRGRVDVGGTAATPESLFIASESYDFAGMKSSAPPCTGDAHCVMLCLVNATPEWQCYDNTGALITGMTQGVGMAYSGTFASAPDGGFFQAMHYINDTAAANRIPRIDSAAMRTLLGSNTYTIGLAGYASTLVTTGPQWWAMATDGTNFLQIRVESGNFNCREKNGPAAAAGTGLNGWSVGWCRRDDASNASARMFSSTGTTALAKQSALASGSFFFGGGTGGCCTPGGSMGGDLAWVVVYDDARSDATLLQYEKNWFGVPTVQSGPGGQAGTTASTATGVTCREVQANGTYVDCFQQGAYLVDNTLGIWASRGWQNAWATDPLAAATWTDVGTPTVTSNASAGPFSRWHEASECDLIVDDDNAAFEGKRSGELNSKLIGSISNLDAGFGVWVNASCYLKTGTSGTTTDKARIRIVHDGTGVDAGSATCDVNLTSSVQRLPGTNGYSNGCWAWIDGASTIKADVLVGQTAATTGSITVCQCQLSNTLSRDQPTVHGSQAGGTFPELDGGNGLSLSAGVPFGPQKGAIEIVFQLPFSTALYQAAGGGTYIDLNKVVGPYLIDAYTTGQSHDVLMDISAFGPGPTQLRPGVQALLYGDSGTYENRFDIPVRLTQSTVNFVAGQWYVMRYEWRTDTAVGPTGESPSCRGKLRIDTCADPDTCEASTLIASNAAGDDLIEVTTPGTCPQATNIVDIGTRQEGSSKTTMHLRRLTYLR